jgi:hypothetical protein
MKKLLLLCSVVLIGLSTPAYSQVEFGVKLGFHSFDLSNPKDIILPGDESISFRDAKIGFQGGIYTHIGLGRVSLEPRLMLNSTRVEYSFNGDNGGIFDNIKDETFTNLDIPVLMGFDFLFFTGLIGPVAHINLNATSDLFDIAGYDERFKTATYGFRAGLCMAIGNLDLSLEYEGNFSEFGDHINIGGQQFSFDDTPSRLVFNLGIRIF